MNKSDRERGRERATTPLRSSRHRAILSAVLLLLSGILAGMGPRPPLVGGPAPDFTLKDAAGHPVRLSDYRGKVALVTFWATWCEPCKKEMPEIEAAYAKNKDRGFVVLAVNFGENPELAGSFIHHGRLTFPSLIDPGVKVASQYGVVSLPVSFFVDPNGLIQERVFGGTLTEAAITSVFERLRKAS